MSIDSHNHFKKRGLCQASLFSALNYSVLFDVFDRQTQSSTLVDTDQLHLDDLTFS